MLRDEFMTAQVDSDVRICVYESNGAVSRKVFKTRVKTTCIVARVNSLSLKKLLKWILQALRCSKYMITIHLNTKSKTDELKMRRVFQKISKGQHLQRFCCDTYCLPKRSTVPEYYSDASVNYWRRLFTLKVPIRIVITANLANV